MECSERDRDRGGRQVKRPKTSTSSSTSESRQQHRDRDRDSKPEEKEKPVVAAVEDVKPPVINKKELYDKITKYELEEAKAMDAGKAYEAYSSVLSNFEENVAEVLALKHGEGLDDEGRMLLKMEGLNYIASLKTINRLLKYKLKIVKDQQFAKRMTVDAEHLKLQNLLYEATNLQNQVAAVQDYKSMDEKIDLILVDQFYKEAPERVTKPDLTKSDPHLLRIARLEYEFIQRQKLTEQCASLEKEKEAIGRSIEEKQAKLDSVGPLLKKIQEATLPLQEFFDLDISARRARNEVSKYLPSPLFVLFVQSEAYQESAEGKRYFSVKIGGDVDAAKQLLVEQEEEEEESDFERNQEQEREVSERRTLRKRSSIGMSLDDNRKRLFQKHPLWIEWSVKSKPSENASVTIHVYYLTKLKIVTVTSVVRRDNADGTVSTSVSKNSEAVLNELFPNDCGMESPNPANIFTLNKFGISAMSGYLKDVGKPYLWAQKICGVEFPTQAGQDSEVQARMDISCKNIEGTLKRIRKRLTNQTKLWNQLKALESKTIIIPAGAKDKLPQKNSTNFVAWEAIDFDTYCNYPFTKPMLLYDGASAKDTFFKATLQRGRGPSGCGKVAVVREIAKKVGAHLLSFNPVGFGFGSGSGENNVSQFCQQLSKIFMSGLMTASRYPTVLLLPRIHLLFQRSNSPSSSSSSKNLGSERVLHHLRKLFDSIPAGLALSVVGTTDKAFLVPLQLRRAGRLEKEIIISPPMESDRLKILQQLCQDLPQFQNVDLEGVASRTPGYVAQDLQKLVRLTLFKCQEEDCSHVSEHHVRYSIGRVVPSVLEGALGVVDIQRAISLDHIAGLHSVKLDLIKAIVWPLKHPQSFLRMGISPPKGILLYGPPGNCKTTLVRAVAASHQTNFLSVSAAELFSSGVGDSEKIVAHLFHRARMASPCILFIDELEAIVGSRQNSEKKQSSTNESILSMLLTEMDGVGSSKITTSSSHDGISPVGTPTLGPLVLVVAATNRPDLIDPALLRPGRFDKLIGVPPLDETGRKELFEHCSKSIPFHSDVNFSDVAKATENYSGADLVNLCKEAAMYALSEDMSAPFVTSRHVSMALKAVGPSLNSEMVRAFHEYGSSRRYC